MKLKQHRSFFYQNKRTRELFLESRPTTAKRLCTTARFALLREFLPDSLSSIEEPSNRHPGTALAYISRSKMSLNQQDLAKLDEPSRNEILQFIESENSKTKVQTSIHQFTNLCFKNCVTSINNGTLSAQEDSCLSNCVNRFLDTNIKVVQNLQAAQQQ
jgi:import inner membrane translocase subunit TIM8